jgi:squalene-hopene/tetraprenyl-beta-curcumene cyclase
MDEFENEHSIKASIHLLSKRLIGEIDENTKYWCGRQWMSVSLTAEYLLLLKYLNLKEKERIISALKEIESRQNSDGGFPAYFNGSSEPSISVICQLALELYQEKSDPMVLAKARDFIKKFGDQKKILLIARFYRFIFRKSTIKGLPQIRPELILWPSWTGISVYNIASWVRSWLVPISVLWHFEKYDPDRTDRTKFRFYSSYLRKKSLSIIEKWLLEHQEKDGSWYGVFSSTMISIMGLYRLGYSRESEYVVKGLDFIHSLQDRSNGTIRQQAFLGPIWDSALSILALTENPSNNFSPHEKTKEFLLENQNDSYGDWSVNNSCKTGGWSFELINKNFPDVDDTAIVLRALLRLGVHVDDPRLKDGLNWLLSMQNRDGSWAAFDKNNNNKLPDWYLKFRKYYIGNGPGLILDEGTPDLTAHSLEALAEFGFNSRHENVKKAVKWLKKHQEKDGSWFGRWGLCYLYGTSSVLCGLKAIGEDMSQGFIQKAIDFLTKHQNKDGGFGEVPEAYFIKAKSAKGPSDATQTAWVIMGLLAAGEHDSMSMIRAIKYLVNELKEDGSYDSMHYQAVAAPPLFQRYELYPVYFPLMALQKFINTIEKYPA